MKLRKRAALAGTAITLALTLPLAGPGQATATEPPRTTIIGGEEAASPSGVVALYTGGGFGCTASLIAPRWVLTAHHCVVGENERSIRAGNLRHEDGTPANVERVVRKPGADMALLYLDREVDAELATLADEDPPVGSVNAIYGWGTIEVGEEAPLSDVLKVGTVTVTSLNGKDAFRGRAVVSRVANAGPGYGDSGGPQMYEGRVVGVCSHGDYVHQAYASVATHRDWIRETSGV